MKYKIAPYRALCSCETFTINGKKASEYEFGNGADHSPGTAEDYACGDHQFTRIPATPEILAKYNITESEYNQICDELEQKLSFGCCGWYV